MRKIVSLQLIFTFLVAISVFAKPLDLLNKKAPDFLGKTEEGKIVKLSDVIKEGKPLVFIFFAVGDLDTYKFLPKLNPLYEKYKDKVNMIAGLLSKSDLKEVKELKKFVPLKMPVWLVDSKAIREYQILKVDVPYILFIDKNGTIKNIIIRPKSTEKIEKNIELLVKGR
jgi:peroxiredoxin